MLSTDFIKGRPDALTHAVAHTHTQLMTVHFSILYLRQGDLLNTKSTLLTFQPATCLLLKRVQPEAAD